LSSSRRRFFDAGDDDGRPFEATLVVAAHSGNMRGRAPFATLHDEKGRARKRRRALRAHTPQGFKELLGRFRRPMALLGARAALRRRGYGMPSPLQQVCGGGEGGRRSNRTLKKGENYKGGRLRTFAWRA